MIAFSPNPPENPETSQDEKELSLSSEMARLEQARNCLIQQGVKPVVTLDDEMNQLRQKIEAGDESPQLRLAIGKLRVDLESVAVYDEKPMV